MRLLPKFVLALMFPLALQAAVPDTLEQRIAPCAACHGKRGEGLKSNEYYPRIAGKPAGYLYNQLANFRDRRRHSPVMNHLVTGLSDEYLREIAAYYAKLPPTETSVPRPAPPALLARGQALMMQGDATRKLPACASCHGKALTGMAPGIPGLVGLDARYVAAQLGAWRNKTRAAQAPDCMAHVASLLVPADLDALSAWISAQAPAGQAAGPLPVGSLRLPMKCGSPDAPAPVAKSPRESGRGEYLVRAGNCLSCHTQRGGKPYAGGRAIPTPFGTLYSTNLTPDPKSGLGRWTAEEFRRALHEGVSRDGALLYPAFPYTNYTRVTQEDADAMYAFLRSIPAVAQPNRPHEMRFPYDQRSLLAGWRALYFKPGVHQDDPKQSAQWNRGAYLVEGLGHCNACHAERNVLGAVKDEGRPRGGLIPMLNWYAPALAAGAQTRNGAGGIAETVALLKTGVSHRGAVFGPMAEVVQDSLQHLSDEDLASMAMYLNSQRAPDAAPAGKGTRVTPEQADAAMKLGERLYKDQCADCHQAAGEGVPRVYPPLAGNGALLAPTPVNAIRITLNGGFPPSTGGNPRPYGMPPFAHRLSDDEVAAVVTYIRGAWGNRASPVSAVDVAASRGVPLE
jgi:cytochrome c553